MSHTINSRIAGIPCLIEVISFSSVKGDPSADSDWDYQGYTESEWRTLDRRGRPAEWLERKLSEKDRERIEDEIEKEMAVQA